MVSFRRRLFPTCLAPLAAVLVWSVAAPVQGQAAKQPAPKTVSVNEYRRVLEDAARTLRAMERKRPRKVGPLLNKLKSIGAVRRDDGAVQKLDDDSWERLAQGLSTSPTRNIPAPPTAPPLPAGDDASKEVTAEIRQEVEGQLKGLEGWTRKDGGAYYTEANAQTIFSQLESSGQIRTGPTWWQLQMRQFSQRISDFFQGIMKWLEGLFPKTTAPKTPNLDLSWLKYFFYAAVAALLAAIFWLIWRQIGGRWRRKDTRSELDLLGEDAELLQLPPDELKDRADRYAEEGNYREALRHRYLSMLLVLDARGVWRHDVRRTNWEHVSLLRKREELRHLVGPLSDITRRFDRVRYGGAECSPDEWRRFDTDVKAVEARSGQAVRA